MAHLFNIYFTYQHTPYHAMVTVHQADECVRYTLKNLDEALLNQLPGNQVLWHSSGKMYFENSNPSSESELMKSVLRAIAAHIEQVSA